MPKAKQYSFLTCQMGEKGPGSHSSVHKLFLYVSLKAMGGRERGCGVGGEGGHVSMFRDNLPMGSICFFVFFLKGTVVGFFFGGGGVSMLLGELHTCACAVTVLVLWLRHRLPNIRWGGGLNS